MFDFFIIEVEYHEPRINFFMRRHVCFPISTKDVAFIIADVNGIANFESPFDISFDLYPIPVHILNTINPKSKFACNFAIVVVLATPQHQIFLIKTDKVCNFLRRLGICNNFFYPNIRFCIHRAGDKFQLVKIIKQKINSFILIRNHPFASKEVEIVALRSKRWSEPTANFKIIAGLVYLNPNLILNFVDMKVVEIIVCVPASVKNDHIALV